MKYLLPRVSVRATVTTAIVAGAACAVFFFASVGSAVQPAVTAPVVQEVIVPQPVASQPLPAVRLVTPKPVVAPAVAPAAAPKVAPKPSHARLLIPSIGVNAVIKVMGYTPEGAMALPANRVDVGWFGPGTVPGQIGSAVIGGHNTWASGNAVFIRLDQLVTGDVVTVVDAQGVATAFVVRGMRTFAATDTESGIFDSLGAAHLNLITCSGIMDALTQEYPTRLVVFTEAIDA